jgi:PAS domain S-box-containing protein
MENKKVTAASNDGFLVVGIGAAAGGIKALEDFFSLMPADSGMAFVVMFPGSEPDENDLSEILTNGLSMPVHRIRRSVRLEADKIYLISPPAHFTIDDGTIRIDTRETVKDRPVGFEHMARLLGKAYGHRSVCLFPSDPHPDNGKHNGQTSGFRLIHPPPADGTNGSAGTLLETDGDGPVIPFADLPARLLAIRDLTGKSDSADGTGEFLKLGSQLSRAERDGDGSHEDLAQKVRRLERELEETRQQLRRTIERHESTVVELDDSEDRFRSIFAGNMTAMGVWQDRGSVTEANDALLELTGYSRSDLESGTINWLELTAPEYRHLDQRALAELFEKGSCEPIEKAFLTKTGERVPVIFGASRFARETNRGSFFVVDLTEPKRREANLAFLTDISEDLANLSNADEIIQTVSAKLGRFLNISSCVFAEIDEKADTASVQYWWQARSGEPSPSGTHKLSEFTSDDFRRMARNKETIIVRDTPSDPRTKAANYAAFEIFSFVTVPFHRQREWKYLLSVNDNKPRNWRRDEVELIDEIANRIFARFERTQAEEALKKSQAQLSLALDASLAGTWTWNVITDIVDWDERFSSMYGITDDQPRTLQSWLNVIHPDDRKRLQQRLTSMIGTPGDDSWNEEFRTFNYPSGERWILSRGRIERNAANQAVLFTGINIDITERQQHEAKLRQIAEFDAFRVWLIDALRSLERPAEIKAVAAQFLGQQLNADRVFYAEVEENGEYITVQPDHYSSVKVSNIDGRYRIKDFSKFMFDEMHANRPLIIADTEAISEDTVEERGVYRRFDIRAFISYPLVKAGKLLAILSVAQSTPRQWTEPELVQVKETAERTWATVERARAENALRQNFEMFSALVENAPFGVYMIDSEFKLRAINSGSKAVFSGIEPLIGRDFAEVLRLVWEEPFATEAINRFRHTLATGESFVSPPIIQKRARIEDIESYDWQIHRITLPDGSSGVVCYFYDLSEQKRLEAAVVQAAELDAFRVRLNDALNSLTDPLEIQAAAACVLGEYVDADRVLYFEIRHSAYVIERDYVNGVPSIRGRHPVDSFGHELLTAYRRGEPVSITDVEAHPNLSAGERQAFRRVQVGAFIGIPLIKDGDFVAGFSVHSAAPRQWTATEFALTREVAERTWAAVERNRAESALQHSENQMRIITDAMPALISYIDKDYRYRFVNKVYSEWFGYPSEALVGRTMSEVLGEKAFADLKPHIDVALSGKVEIFENDARYKQGARFIRATYTPDFARNGTVRGIFVLVLDITERKLQEEALRQSEERYRGIVNQSISGIAEIDLDGKFLTVNNRYCEIVGYSRGELLAGMRMQDLTHPDDMPENRRRFERLAKDGVTFEIEKRYIRKDGTNVWVNNSVFAIKNAAGKPQSIAAVVLDISLRRQAEDDLRESEERFRTMADHAPVMIWVTEADGSCSYLSKSWYDYTGQTPETGLGFGYLDMIHPDDREADKRILHEATNGQEPFKFEHRLRNQRGEYRWVISSAQPRFDQGGEFLGFIGSVLDITDRKEAEATLLAKDELLTQITNVTPTLLTRCSGDLRYLFVNRSAAEYLGRPSDEIIGRPIREILGEKAFEQTMPYVSRVLAGEYVEYETEILYSAAGRRFMQVIYVPERNKQNEVIGWFATMTDFTDRKKSEETKAFLASIIESSDDAVISKDLGGTITTWNNAAERIFGYAADEIIGRPITVLIPAILGDEESEIIERLQNGMPIEHYETIRQRRDGSLVNVSLTVSPIRNYNDEVIGVSKIARDITERKQAELALRQSEARLRLAMEISALGTWDLDYQTERMIWSDKLFEIFGLEPVADGRMSLADWENLVYPEDLERVNAVNREAREEHRLFNTEYRIRRRDTGEIRWLSELAQFFYDENGLATRCVGIVRDITTRKEAEDKLRQSEEFNSIIATISTDWAFSARVEPDGTVFPDAITKGFARQLGYRFEKMAIRAGWQALIHPKDLPFAVQELNKLLLGETVRGEIRLVTRKGQTVISEYQTRPIMNEEGQVTRIYGAIRDITMQKLSEQRLRESEERLQDVISSATEYAIFTVTLEGVINSWSVGAQKIFGYQEHEIIGQSFEILFTPANRRKNIPALEMKNALTQGRAADDRFHLRRDGSRFFASGVMMPLLKNGVVTGYVKITRDMTNQIMAEKAVRDKEILQKLVRAQEEERRRIARDLHDELGQQLTALRLKLESTRRICDNAKIADEINVIQQIAKQLDQGVDFLAWELRPVALDDLGLYAALDKYVNEWAGYSGINAEILPSTIKGERFPSDIETNLYRIAQEALNNVSKHAGAGKVEIQLEKRNNIIVLIIADDGVGFNPKTKYIQNKGIGLVGMQERALLIGGQVEIESTAGEGTTLFIRVPVPSTKREKNNER